MPTSPAARRLKGRLLLLLGFVMGLNGCASKKDRRQPGLGESLPPALNAAGVRGIVGGTLRNPASSTWRLLHHASAAVEELIQPGMETFVGGSGKTPPVSHRVGMDMAAFEAELDRKIRPTRTRGTLRFLIDGRQYFPVLIDALRTTREPVDMQVYIFDTDDVAVNIADELKKTAERVPVRVLFDDLGSVTAAKVPPKTKMPSGFKQPPDILAYLRQDSRIDARRLNNTFLTSAHTKMVIFDNSRAFTGGMNIGREYRYEWHDMMVEMRGPIVSLMKEEFTHSLSRTNFADNLNTLQAKTEAAAAGAFDIRLLRTRPFQLQIQSAIHLAIRRAQRRIWIEDPYLADDGVVRALIEARQRGVDVRVIQPNKSDEKVMGGNNKATAAVMLKHGIRVFTYPGVSHVKASLYDDWALFGSANMDHLSLRVNDELDIACSHPRTVKEFETRLFLQDFKVSKEESLQSVKPSARDKLAEMMANHL